MDDSQLVNQTKAQIQGLNWHKWPDDADKRSVHDRIQAHLVVLGDDLDYIGVPEAQSRYEGGKGLFDVGWYDGNELVAAFEIDETVKQKSVRKLRAKPDSAVKVIVSKFLEHDRLSSQDLPTWCEHIDADCWPTPSYQHELKRYYPPGDQRNLGHY